MITDEEIEDFARETVGNDDNTGWGIVTGAEWMRNIMQVKILQAIDLTLKMHDNCIEEGHVMATKAKILEQLTKLK